MPQEREKVVISLGGSILVPGEGDAEYIRSLAQLLIASSSKYTLFCVTGGGKIARYYIETGRKLSLDERYLDELGIDATRINARLLIGALGGAANPLPATNYEEAIQAADTYAIIVMGGVEPGLTTDSVSTELAARVGAKRIVNATSVDGVYSANPRTHPTAKKLDVLSHEELIALVGTPQGQAGPTAVFDPLAARLAAKSRIPVYVVHGRDFLSVEGAIQDGDFEGTRVVAK